MPTICKLIDDDGNPVAEPVLMDAAVSWRAADGIAQAFDSDGRIVAEIRNARVDWIEAGGIRFVGVETTAPGGTAVRAQEWQYNPR